MFTFNIDWENVYDWQRSVEINTERLFEVQCWSWSWRTHKIVIKEELLTLRALLLVRLLLWVHYHYHSLTRTSH